MIKYIFAFSLILIAVGCSKSTPPSETNDLLQYVNPFIGTGGHGHTYPGASMPFGMVQLSPDTRLEGWDGCGGYHYSDSVVYGFSHTHLSGTGVSDYGDVLFMPTTGTPKFENGYKSSTDDGYASRFNHANESASPGFYEVKLQDYDIDVELTVTPRCGFHQYTFNSDEPQHIILDLEHRDRLLDADIEVIDDRTIRGKRISKAWAEEQHIYFYAEFSQPFKSHEFQSSTIGDQQKKSKAAFQFDLKEDQTILLRVGISAVSMDGAEKNLKAEINHWDFAETKAQAEEAWQKKLNKIVVQSKDEDKKTIFYTALYHSLLNPNLFMDVDNHYRGMDQQIHQATDYTHHTVFSFWDTFRATHPLFTIIEQEHTNDLINTLLSQYGQGGILPIWELAGNYTGCMIGYHGVPVIVDAYVKGIRDYDTDLAFEAIQHSASQNQLGLDALKESGFISAEREPESVSKTLEYAYDDWCIAEMAEAMNKPIEADAFYKRGQFYKNIFDPTTGFMRAKMNNTWFAPFDPAEVNYNYTEANSWQYSMFVPQDISGLIDLYGGPDAFDQKLDALFTTPSDLSGRHQVDITGLIGQYAHGNEPSHHMAYLYNYIGKPHKTQERVSEILETMYHNAPDGLSGNEDCGQMSSWYVLSAMGIYPVTPGLPYYTIGSPIMEEASIHLENGKTFTIRANSVSTKNNYIQSAKLNGTDFKQSFIQHSDIIKGGTLTFDMGNQKNEAWFTTHPKSSIEDQYEIVPVPYFSQNNKTFTDSLELELSCADSNAVIHYRLSDETEFKIYDAPINLKSSNTIYSYAANGSNLSFPIQSSFYKIEGGRSIELSADYANQYAAGGDHALIDYQRGGENYRTGAWQGYQGQDFEATVNLGQLKSFEKISVGFLQDIQSWIWYPPEVQFELSVDGQSFQQIGTIINDFPDDEYGAFTQDFTMDGKYQAQYIRIKAPNYGDCPTWHLGSGGKTWLFIDEVVIE